MPVIYLAISSNAYTQEQQISGRIVDLNTGSPISDATVYINGTSNGVISDQEGNFRLPGIALPSELIISHVSDNLKKFPLWDADMLENLQFGLDQKLILLEEATVIGESLRADYLNRFKTWFLGSKYKEHSADVLNDSVLVFNIRDENQFSVYSEEPIVVDLPATGYILKVDLVKFDLTFKAELEGFHCSILGYFYFNPIEPKSPRKERAIARSRTEHYYNSRMHFCRSLYHNNLAENGYVFEQACNPEESEDPGNSFIHHMKASYGQDEYGNQQLLLTRISCNNYGIRFYNNARNRPVDLTFMNSKPNKIEWSGLLFLNDSIHIYPSGRTPENSILFSKTIANKGITSMLPEDYIPSMR